MDTPDDQPPATLTRTAKHEDELNNLGRSWFAELRQQSERDAEEFADWKRGHRKWTVFNKRSAFSDFDSPPGEGDGSG
jgi:hypothetical protein